MTISEYIYYNLFHIDWGKKIVFGFSSCSTVLLSFYYHVTGIAGGVCVCGVHVHMLQFLFALEQSGVSLKGEN